MAFHGIKANLVVYLTRKLHEGTVTSANNVTNWAGTTWMTPILGAFIADTYLGRYWTIVSASTIHLLVIKYFYFARRYLYMGVLSNSTNQNHRHPDNFRLVGN